MIKVIAIILTSAMLLAACATVPPPHVSAADATSDADEALYRQRFARLRDKTSATGLPSYDTLKAVPGSAVHNAWKVVPDNAAVSDAAIRRAIDYAGARNTSALMVWQDGNLRVAQYFDDTTQESLLVSKSLAKPLSVIAVGRAIAEGHIASLDTRVSEYFYEWRDTPKASMTVRQLLGMRSGLLPQGTATSVDDVLNKAYLHPRHDDIIINDYPLVNAPGERYEYSNANGELVAPLIERATGVAYEDWVSREVLAPLGAAGGEVWMNRVGGTPHSGCCWLLPAETYLRLAVLYLNDGMVDQRRLLPVGYVEQIKKTSGSHPHAGLGLYVAGDYVEWRGPLNPEMTIGRNYHSEPYLADDLYLFDGNSNQVVYIVPSAGLVVARFGGRPSADAGWDNTVLPNTVIRGLDSGLQQRLVPQPVPATMSQP